MPQDPAALLQHYRSMRAAMLAAISGLTDEALAERSLDGWSVKDHLAHLAAWDDARASEVRRISAGHDALYRMGEAQAEQYSRLAYELSAGLGPDQVRWELAESHARVLAAIEAATRRGLDGSLYGEAGLRSAHEAQHTDWILRWRSGRTA